MPSSSVRRFQQRRAVLGDDGAQLVDADGRRMWEPRGPVRWRARYRDEAGVEDVRLFDRKADAQEWVAGKVADGAAGRGIPSRAGRVTFAVWFADWSARQVWVEGTFVAAQQAADSVPFSSVLMRDIRRSHVEAWVKAMTKPAESRREGLAPSTIRTRFNYVHSAFLAAVNDRVVGIDPTKGVRLPRVRRAEAAMAIPTPGQVASAVEAASPEFRAFVQVCAFAGLRLGEAAGLRLSDVDFPRRTLTVARQVQGTNASNATIVDPKQGSERVIPIPLDLTKAISEHVRRVGVWGDQEYLFGVGELLYRGTAGHQWRRLRAKVPGLEVFTLHDLRHFYASGLIAAGCDVVTVQRALGHRSPAITLGVYSHLWPTAEDKTRTAAADLMKAVEVAKVDSSRIQQAVSG